MTRKRNASTKHHKTETRDDFLQCHQPFFVRKRKSRKPSWFMVPSSWSLAENPNFCDLVNLVMFLNMSWQNPRWWVKISQHCLQSCGIWSWRSTASHASWAVPSRSHHECFFFKIGQLKHQRNTSMNGKVIFDLKVWIVFLLSDPSRIDLLAWDGLQKIRLKSASQVFARQTSSRSWCQTRTHGWNWHVHPKHGINGSFRANRERLFVHSILVYSIFFLKRLQKTPCPQKPFN